MFRGRCAGGGRSLARNDRGRPAPLASRRLDDAVLIRSTEHRSIVDSHAPTRESVAASLAKRLGPARRAMNAADANERASARRVPLRHVMAVFAGNGLEFYD